MSVNTFLWFDTDAEQAARRYVELVPNSRVVEIAHNADGSVFIVTVELDGHAVTLMNGGPSHPHTDAASIQVTVDTQEELDRLWDGLTEGGAPGPCGWLIDRWGLSWQVVPAELPELMTGADPAASAAVGAALRTMSKLDIAALRAAHDNA
ncbi:VOC family protein [Nocardia arizonensis]|uniref:VOC family protein n=1 Tax=Nocardia arizonensis TaxID=1141647 RepID=UPI0006D293BC|nr:VOC family protein [Nocardia arizonensis]